MSHLSRSAEGPEVAATLWRGSCKFNGQCGAADARTRKDASQAHFAKEALPCQPLTPLLPASNCTSPTILITIPPSKSLHCDRRIALQPFFRLFATSTTAPYREEAQQTIFIMALRELKPLHDYEAQQSPSHIQIAREDINTNKAAQPLSSPS